MAERWVIAGATGWRTRVRLDTSADGRAGFHRYHSAELVNDLSCAQLPAGMLDGLADRRWPPWAHMSMWRSMTTAASRGGGRPAAVATAAARRRTRGGRR